MIQIYTIQMEEMLIIHVVDLVGTVMIDAGVDRLSRDNNWKGIMRSIEPLKFIHIHLGDLENSKYT